MEGSLVGWRGVVRSLEPGIEHGIGTRREASLEERFRQLPSFKRLDG